jgi:uncharacterized membrane protein
MAERFRIGSAAVFWIIASLLVWMFFYVGLGLGRERHEVRWFFAWYFSLPVAGLALFAAVVQNVSHFGGCTRRQSSVAAWVGSCLAFVPVAYITIRRLFFGG